MLIGVWMILQNEFFQFDNSIVVIYFLMYLSFRDSVSIRTVKPGKYVRETGKGADEIRFAFIYN